MSGEVEVVIVGAGAAGVGAALELRDRGVSCVVLEAADRVGGRAYTDRASLGVPWDHGCHWMHSADRNPLVAWADRLGADVFRQSPSGRFAVWDRGGFAPEEVVAEALAATDAAFTAVEEAEHDVPIPEVWPDLGRWHAGVRTMFTLMAGEEPSRVSAAGYGDYIDTDTNWPVRSGYGDLIERMAQGLPIRTGVRVSEVRHDGSGVAVETDQGTLKAGAAIVTVSTNVLTSGTLRLGPGPASDLLPSIAGTPCGAYEKIAFRLHALPADLDDLRFFLIAPEGAEPVDVQVVGGAAPMLIVHVGGDHARALVREGEVGMKDFATRSLLDVFGGGFRENIAGCAVTGWTENPFVLGSYSAARPGNAAARRAMIDTDTGTIALAGEAFSLNSQATAHGAYESGRKVAGRIAARLA